MQFADVSTFRASPSSHLAFGMFLVAIFNLFSEIQAHLKSGDQSYYIDASYTSLQQINNMKRKILYLQEVLSEEKNTSFICKGNNCHIYTTRKDNLISNIEDKLRLYKYEMNNLIRRIEPIDYMHESSMHSNHQTSSDVYSGVRHKRSATAIPEKLWDFGVIPYVIEPRFTTRQKELFMLAMEVWEKNTCLVFKEKEPEDKNYLIFTVRPCGCCSFVGKKGDGGQAISIGKNCDKLGIIMHELGHAIGFWHEHTRPDRDQFVQIFLDNVLPDKKSNFDALNDSEVNSIGETYDYESIMHYSRNTFAKIAILDTILPRLSPNMLVRPDIGQRNRLSPGDIRQTKKLYKCTECGKTFHLAAGNFSYEPKLGTPELCQWRITASYGERVILNITLLNITTSENCDIGYLEVRDGHYAKSPSLGKFCGSEISSLPSLIVSSARRMWVEFKSSGGLDGFSANYKTLCGGNVMKEEGMIASPSYPHNYPPKSHCVWNITVPESFVVVLTFDVLDLEFDDNCSYDSLIIRDGLGDSATQLGKFCGYKTPKEIRSTRNHLSLEFQSDSQIEKYGFSINFVKEKDECLLGQDDCDHACINTLGSYRCECNIGFELHSNGKTCRRECGGNITDNQGNITSPSFPDQYPPNKACVWMIVAPKDHTIFFNFTQFDLEGNREKCLFDFVSVNRAGRNDPKTNDIFCGNELPKPIRSKGNVLRVEFKSDGYDQKSGFVAFFSTDKNECDTNNGGCDHICKNTIGSYRCYCRSGFILQNDQHSCVKGYQKEVTAPKGYITSPDYPERYPRDMECEWHFSTKLGHRVRLSFKILELEPHQHCIYDNVIVYDGDHKNASILGRYCGFPFPEQIISSGTDMLLLFTTDNSVQRKGFVAEHDTICDTRLDATFDSRVLVSHPGYGLTNYDSWSDCRWLFVASEGLKVEILFDTFNLENHGECLYDSLAVYDGENEEAPLLDVYCGKTVPPSIVSSTKYLFLSFTTDNTINKKGFQLKFYSVAKSQIRTDYVD